MPSSRKIQVAIIGAGEIGQAIKHLIDPAAGSVEIWDVAPGLVPDQKPLDKIVSRAQVLFFCVPSWVLNDAVKSCAPYLKPRTLVVSISKGIESTTGKTMDEFWPAVLPANQKFALLLGPMLAQEIREDLGAVAVVAAARHSSFDVLRRLFTSAIRLEYIRDVRGAALASVLKNIYSLALGIADGLEWGGNRKGWLASQAIHEMTAILKTLKAKKDTASSPAGVPDLLATGYSPYSHNVSTGHELIVKGECTRKSEGLVSIKPFLTLLGEQKNDYPLLVTLERVLDRCDQAQPLFEELFKAGA